MATRQQLRSVLPLLAALTFGTACDSSDECEGERYYDSENATCRPCPESATFEDGTCACPAQMEFVDNRCRPAEGAGETTSDGGGKDEPLESRAPCEAYCEFLKGCFADNDLATSVAPEVVTALEADDPPACLESCEAMTSGDDGDDPVDACIGEGLADAACVGDDSASGLLDAIELIDACCAESPGNALCESFCEGVKVNDIVSGMVEFCSE